LPEYFIAEGLIMQIGVEAQRAVENRRVFVLDEDEINRTVLQFMLADDNETHEFATVDAALEKGLDWQPDLVLLSAMLVIRDGVELLHNLRSAWPGVKLLVICEAADDESIAAAMAAGADDTLTRPFKVEPVRRKVDRHLGRKVEIKIPVVVS
jgi:DNA-binding response OmpR family regulator